MQVERKIDDLNRLTWGFMMIDKNIVLSTYSVWNRETKRHGWKIVDAYSSHNRRGSSFQEIDVPLPEDVKEEALNLYVSMLRVCKFSDRIR